MPRPSLSSLVTTHFLAAGNLAEVLEYEDLRNVYEQMPGATIVEHERGPFTSYPYEWPAEMLYAAADLTLKLAEKILDDGLGLIWAERRQLDLEYVARQSLLLDLEILLATVPCVLTGRGIFVNQISEKVR